MSKIYEALLRAELERTAAVANGGLPEPVPAETEAQRILGSLSPGMPAANGSAAMPLGPLSGPSSVRAAAVNVVAESAPTIDWERTLSRTWKPSLLQLPALEERGSGVEQFRSLRSRMHEFRDLNPLKSIIVSSGLPQEGKSFVAANLAISFARHKASRVLLIDGDMRRSSLHTVLGCTPEPGLTEYLAGRNTLYEVMQRAKPNEDGTPLLPGLGSVTFIAGGADADNAADLSGSSRFGELIRAAEPVFDWIVVDTPPVNLVADGVNLARSCDGTLLIARGGVTKYESAQRALAELKAANVLGIVLNAVEKPQIKNSYYGYDSYDSYVSKKG